MVVPKMSSRNVIGVIGGGRLATENVNGFDADKYIQQCQQRLKTDPHYKQCDYDVDVVRCKALKMPPNRLQNVQPTRRCDKNVFNLTANNDDGDIFNGFDTFITNPHDKNNGNAGRFPHNPPLSTMNLATPESRSSFFFY